MSAADNKESPLSILRIFFVLLWDWKWRNYAIRSRKIINTPESVVVLIKPRYTALSTHDKRLTQV
jgi:hypothetical protein